MLGEYGRRIEFSSERRVNGRISFFSFSLPLSHKLTSKIGNLANSSDTAKSNLDFTKGLSTLKECLNN